MSDTQKLFFCFIQPHLRALRTAARQYAALDQDVNDLVQETLLRAWRNYSPTKESDYRPSWLFVIMRNISLEWHRTATRRIKIKYVPDEHLTEMAVVNLQDPFPAFGPLSEEKFRDFLDERLAEAWDALNSSFREVLVLSLCGDLSYREIAEVLDCPIGTVMSRVARARRELREHLAGRTVTKKRMIRKSQP